MAVIPYTPEYNTLQLEILVNGSNDGLHNVLRRAEVHYELNKIPYAKLHFISSNPDIDPEDNPLQSDVLEVNDEIEIKVNSGEDAETLFKGIIYKVAKNANPSSGFETKVDCKDIAINLTSQMEVVADESFGEKMERFVQEIEMTHEVDIGSFGEEMVTKTQNVTPWDYILSYLDSLGFLSTIREGIFTVYDSTADPEEATYLAKNGVNVFEFEGRQEESVADVEVRYWNPETQSVETQESSTQVENGSGREVIDMGQSNFTPETLGQIAAAVAAKNRLATVHGKVKTFGNLTAKYGENITFEKVNPSIDETPLLIRTESHVIENGLWTTEYDFGLEDNKSFVERINSDTSDNTNRTGQNNNIQGLLIGVVTQIEEDPMNEFRIRVRIPSISDAAEGVWARLSSLQAGNERGAFFIPEVDDEVILGCLNNNPDTPVILGKLYSSAHPMPFPLEADNNIQGIVSKEGTQILINDEDKSIELSTQAGNKILINDADDGIILEDQNGNSIQMNKDGITIDSSKDLVLKAAKDITIEGTMSTIKAQSIMEISGQLITLN
ncbi:MAG: hypothetical protein KTR22_01975 [Flavobacteriaceae bacterium]|nr:hypothetical protein [Flavobacteriaceae bacterium]